jgi:signal transduction histidine kinase
MNEPHPTVVRHGVGRVVLIGMGVALALLVGLGVYAVRSLSAVSIASSSTTREYFRQAERLEIAQNVMSAAASAVRDYLLDPDISSLARHRDRAKVLMSQERTAIEDYAGVASQERNSLVGRLRAEVSNFQAAANGALRLSGGDRSASGVNLHLNRLVPLRDQALSTIGEIATRDRSDLRSAAAQTGQFVQAAERRLWTVIVLTVLLALLVAGTTVVHLMRLQRIASERYHASVRAGVELEKLSRRLLTLQEDERRRIARELHDDLGQRLASVLFELSTSTERTDVSPELRLTIEHIAEQVSDVAKDLQQLSRSLHSAVLDKIGLEAAIRSDCSAIQQRTSFDVDFKATAVPKRLPEAVSLTAYRVFQEALQNAIKHSHTDRLDVSLTAEAQDLVLRVKDYGMGFAMEPVNRPDGLGLVSMRERLKMVRGVFRIDSSIGKGTQVEARIPMLS